MSDDGYKHALTKQRFNYHAEAHPTYIKTLLTFAENIRCFSVDPSFHAALAGYVRKRPIDISELHFTWTMLKTIACIMTPKTASLFDDAFRDHCSDQLNNARSDIKRFHVGVDVDDRVEGDGAFPWSLLPSD